MAQKLQSLEWVPYYDPDYYDAESLYERQLVENPIAFQNIWPGGIRIPEEIPAAIKYMKEEYGQDEADGLRQQINRWRALQRHYLDCGWGTEAWDGDAFWQKRVAWIRDMNVLYYERMRSQPSSEYQTEHYYAVRQEIEEKWNRFFFESAGERAV